MNMPFLTIAAALAVLGHLVNPEPWERPVPTQTFTLPEFAGPGSAKPALQSARAFATTLVVKVVDVVWRKTHLLGGPMKDIDAKAGGQSVTVFLDESAADADYLGFTLENGYVAVIGNRPVGRTRRVLAGSAPRVGTDAGDLQPKTVLALRHAGKNPAPEADDQTAQPARTALTGAPGTRADNRLVFIKDGDVEIIANASEGNFTASVWLLDDAGDPIDEPQPGQLSAQNLSSGTFVQVLYFPQDGKWVQTLTEPLVTSRHPRLQTLLDKMKKDWPDRWDGQGLAP